MFFSLSVNFYWLTISYSLWILLTRLTCDDYHPNEIYSCSFGYSTEYPKFIVNGIRSPIEFATGTAIWTLFAFCPKFGVL